MLITPQKWTSSVKQGYSNLVATSRSWLRRFDPSAPHNATDFNSFDESTLQQGRFWMRTVTWTLIGTSLLVWPGWP